MKKGYKGAGFSTIGNWIIPFVLGWSKSIVSMGSRPIGIMYTIHITPYFNIGVNNPKPKHESKPNQSISDCGCMGNCGYDCECDCDIYYTETIDPSLDKAHDFVLKSDDTKIYGCYSRIQDDNPVIVILVSDENVEVPEDFDGVKTIKEIITFSETNNEIE